MKNKIQKLLKERYFLPHEDSWENDLAKRVSAIYPPIYEDVRDKKFIPSSPTLMNANTAGARKGTLSSCFTMGIEDSIDGIMDSLKECAVVTKASGGVGYVFSNLRSSKEGIVGLSGKLSSGPLPFANMFNSVLDGIQQGGVRRGAGMFQFDIDAPDILDVIRAKNNKGVLERFNVSIRVTDEFYERLKNKPDAPHYVKQKNNLTYILEDNGKPVTVKALWNEIIEYAWKCAEPGIFNVDIATRQCTTTNIDPIVLSNPCVLGDTLILTNKGFIEIEKLTSLYKKDSDVRIITTDKTNQFFESKLHWCGITKENDDIVKVSFDNGEFLLVNKTHKFLDKNMEKHEVQSINVGDEVSIMTITGETKIIDIEFLDMKRDVYDLTCSPNFNFFALRDYESDFSNDQIVINDCLKYYQYDLVKTDKGVIFAKSLDETFEIM